MNRITDVKKTVNRAIQFVISYPCCICSYENAKNHECCAGIKYRGTCKIYRYLKGQLRKMKEMEDK